MAFEPVVSKADEVACKLNPESGQFEVLVLLADTEQVLHEDGTFRKPHPHALAVAWAVARSMNKRMQEDRNKRNMR